MYPRRKKISYHSDSSPNSGTRGRLSRVLRHSSDGRLEGAALVIVLAFLVIITGLVVAFLSSVTNEATATSASAAGVTTRSLADAAIQLDIAQIRDATAGYSHGSDGSLNMSSPVAWASQPGAIRTWGTNPYATNGGGAGLAGGTTIYKLYSAQVMVDSSGGNPANDLPTNSSWVSNSAIWTDLNSPVVSSGNTNYPIIDPVMTNTANGLPVVEGFSIDTSSVSISGVANQAAMPMRWIYVLKNGTITTPSAGSSNVASFSTNAPSASNPIVGRIAFWTDDETCKLNINTASEGSFWAPPNFSTSLDAAFGLFPPSTREYYRYPGHPASTSLSPVLWSYLNLTNPSLFVNGLPGIATTGATLYSTNTNTGVITTNLPSSYNIGSGVMSPADITTNVQTYLSNIITIIAPRYAWGGSFAGRKTLFTNNNLFSASTYGSPLSGSNLSNYRLYASVDEMFYAPTNPAGQTNGRVITPFLSNAVGSGPGVSIGTSGGSARMISALRFFLTTDSRAPEVNPLNLPKITLWPVPSTNNAMKANSNSTSASATRTLTDQTIAFCSSLGTNPYYFTRYDATSTNNDLSGRNATLYSYLCSLLNSPVPGYPGGSFTSGKWTTNQANQITTLLFDYIRSCINLADTSMATNAAAMTSSDLAYCYTAPVTTNGGLSRGTGQVVPIVATNGTKGIGRFPTLRGATLWFIAREANIPPVLVGTNGRPIVYDSTGSNVISAADGSLNSTYIQNMLAGTNYYVAVNPMHPWTTPPLSSGTTNTLRGGTIIQAGGLTLIPNLKLNSAPVFAMANPQTNQTLSTAATNVYPVFDLSETNTGGTLVRTYPTLDGSYTCMTAAASNAVISVPVGRGSSNYPCYIAGNYGFTNGPSTNCPPANGTVMSGSAVTHPGLCNLSIQSASGTNAGAFSLANSLSKDPVISYGSTRVEMCYVPDFVNVAPGQVGLSPNITMSAQGLTSFQVNSTNMLFANTTPGMAYSNVSGCDYSMLYDLGLQFLCNASSNSLSSTNALIATTNTFTFNGGQVTNQIYGPGGSPQVQTIAINFPNGTFPTPKLVTMTSTWHVYPPTHATNWTRVAGATTSTVSSDLVTNSSLTFNANTSLGNGGGTRLNNYYYNGFDYQSYLLPSEMNVNTVTNDVAYPWYTNGLDRITCDTLRSVDLIFSDPRVTACLSSVPTNCFSNNPLYFSNSQITVNGWPTYLRSAHSLRTSKEDMNGGRFGTLLCVGTNSTGGTNSYFYPPMMASTPVAAQGPINGATSPTNFFAITGARFNSTTGTIYLSNQGHNEQPYAGVDCDFTISAFMQMWLKGGDFDNGIGFYADGPFINKVDEGFGSIGSGAFQQNPYFSFLNSSAGGSLFSANRMVPSPVVFGSLPVFDTNWSTSSPQTSLTKASWRTLQFSPNPNAYDTNALLARNAAAGYSVAGSKITNTVIPDHLLLDFFQMPVVDPYPISDSFSTAGKVNMNYQIAPFYYINRDSAMRGALKALIITAVDDQWGYDYKLRNLTSYDDNNAGLYSDSTVRTNPAGLANAQSYDSFGSNSANFYFNYPVHATETLRQFTNRFGQNDLFHSPSEICSLWLYPAKQPSVANPTNNTAALTNWDSTNANIMSWWYANPGVTRKSLTGDNVRERPYNYLYPRLTTKSNTYQIHYRVQTLKQNQFAHASNAYATWIDPAAGGITDKVLGEQRGSAVIERFIDPSNPSIPDFASVFSSAGGGASLSATNCMDSFYQLRVFNAKQFTP